MVRTVTQTPSIIETWANAISLRNPQIMTSFYCQNAVLVGTFSKPFEIDKDEIYKYFVDFLSVKRMSCKILEQVCQQGEVVMTSSGVYEFTIDGETTRARFTYTLIPINGEYKILNHHSSVYDG